MLTDRRRDSWRALPLQTIVSAWIDCAQLAFDDEHEQQATMLRAEIDDLYARWRKAFTPEKKKAFALRIRRQWLRLCSIAIGVRVPGSSVVWGFTE